MTRSIIVPLDTKLESEVALDVATKLAREQDAAIYLFSVIEAPFELAVWLRAKETIDAWAERNIEVDAYLTSVAERIVEANPELRVETLVSTGHPAPEIAGFAAQQPEPLIVMAAPGRSGLERFLAGSVPAAVLHQAPCPVILVRQPREDEGVAEFVIGDFDRMLVALDGSEFAEQALAAAQVVFGGSGLTLHLVRIVETSKWFGATYYEMDYSALSLYLESELEAARIYLQQHAEKLEAAGHTVTWEARAGLVADEITEIARDQNAGLIVMATHGRTGPGRVLIGSVAERVVRQADRPVFLVNPNPAS